MNMHSESSSVCIGFFMETSFHYEIYRNIIDELVIRNISCELIINDLIEPGFVSNMTSFLDGFAREGVTFTRLSTVLKSALVYSALISPYYLPIFKKISRVNIRAMYGLAKNEWNHAVWNAQYDAILCYSHYTARSLSGMTTVNVVGNPRFDDWHNKNYDHNLPQYLKSDPTKKTILYAPTYGGLSSLSSWAEKISRLQGEYNIITKLHHGTLYRPTEIKALKLARKFLKNTLRESDSVFSLLHSSDYVISDNSGFVFDAINADKKIILLEWDGMHALLDKNQSFSTLDSPEQKIKGILPVVSDMVGMRKCLSDDYPWENTALYLQQVKRGYCDAFNDGLAGARAAAIIISTLERKQTEC